MDTETTTEAEADAGADAATEADTSTGAATYCPEDDTLRLYVGRVPRAEYESLRAAGWRALHKQREAGGGDFAATWTPSREDTALAYSGGIIDDEDMGPAERAADRAERFAGYRDRREGEAVERADTYEAGPQVHGYQNAALAKRRAAALDRVAGRAVNAWDKAEYWQRRTAGVIGHALYVAGPGVRMGRIKKLEAELRKIEKAHAESRATWERWTACAAMTDAEAQTKRAQVLAYIEHGDYTHPRTGRKSYLFDFTGKGHDPARETDPLNGADLCALWLADNAEPTPEPCGRWHNHITLRLAYEAQMLEAQGGRAAMVEMEPGGWIGKHQLQKVNKSPATGRVVSVAVVVVDHGRWGEKAEAAPRVALLNVERLAREVYRAPTDEERAAFEAARKAEKKSRAETTPKGPPLVNPTDADAERLQAAWNDEARQAFEARRNPYTGRDFRPAQVCRISQAAYAANSGGAYSVCETREVSAGGSLRPTRDQIYSARIGAGRTIGTDPALAKVRATRAADKGQEERPDALRVIVLTDKPQKALPADVWTAAEIEKAREAVTA